MRILVDENIPAAHLAFGQFGEVDTVAGRSLNEAEGRKRLKNIDALIVRSVTQVNRDLLSDTSVRFVGSTTIGCDHLDLAYLSERGISVANAPGSNADSVVDYVLSAICSCDTSLEKLIGGGRVGIIGHGNVGSRLSARIVAMGIDCVAYDPLLPKTGIRTELDSVLQSEVLCLHTPLTREGDFPSYHMLDLSLLQKLPQDAVIISAGRGEVVASEVLLELARLRPDIQLVLDVWEPEPALPMALLEACKFGTPHIAGYSADGKLRGTEMVAKAMATALGISFDPGVLHGVLPDTPVVKLSAESAPALLREAIHAVYQIANDDQRLREALAAAKNQAARNTAFDFLRKTYPSRRELSICDFILPRGVSEHAKQLLRAACGSV